MRKRLGQTIPSYLREHQSLYVFTIVLFTMGIIFGAVTVNSLADAQKQELHGLLQMFFTSIDQNGIPDPPHHFQLSAGHYLKTAGLMWVLGLSIIGVPMILLLLFVKGVLIGFTVGFLVQQMSGQGMLVALLGVLPHNMLVVPALIIAGVAGISFSLRLVKTRLVTRRGDILPHFINYTLLVLAMTGVLTAAALFEAFVSPVFLQYVIT